MAGPGRAARGRLTEPPCWPRAALRRFLPQCPAPRGGDRRGRRGRAGPRRTSGRRFRSPPSAAASGFRRAAPHFRSGPPPLSPRDFRPLLNTSGCSHPPLSQRDFLSLRPHFRSFPSTESRRHFRSLLHTSGPPLVPCHRGIRISGPHFRSSPPSVTAGFRSPVHPSGPSLPTGSVRGAPLWTPNPLPALQTGTSGAAIALLGTPRYPYRNQRSAPQPHFRFPL